MNPAEIISDLREQNIELWVEGGSLKYRSPKGSLTEELKLLLKENKSAIIEFLSKPGPRAEYPLSFNQQSLWFMYLMHPDSAAYNVAVSFRILSGIDIKGLQYAFNKIIEHHAILRTTYGVSNDTVVQRIGGFNEVLVEHVNAAGISESGIKDIVAEVYKKPFNLEKGPVVRLALFELKHDEYILLLVIHHIACDAFSLKILMEEFSGHYNEYSGNTSLENAVSVTSHTYNDFIDYQKNILADKIKRGELSEFWRMQLAHKVKTGIPRDFDYPESFRFNGSSYYFTIGNNEYEKLLTLSRGIHVSVNSILSSIFEVLLFSITGQDDISFGLLSSGRSRKEHFDVCGYFINPVIRRAKNRPGTSFKEYASLVHKDILKILDHQDYPFPVVVEEFEKERNFKTTPGFQVLFNYMNRHSLGILSDLLSAAGDNKTVMLGNLPVAAYPIDQQEGQFEITFEVIDNDKSLYCNMKYNTDLYRRETIEKVSSAYLKIVSAVLDNPDVTMGDLISVNSEPCAAEGIAEYKQLVVAANFTIESAAPSIQFWLDSLELNFKIEFAPYNQVFQQLLDKDSVLHKNRSGVNVIVLRLEEWIIEWSGEQMDDRVMSKFNELKNDFLNAFSFYNSSNPGTAFIICTPYSERIKNNPGLFEFITSSENEICGELNKLGGTHAYTHHSVDSLYHVKNYYEELGEKIGHMPYTGPYFAAVGTFIVRKIFALYHRPYKVIVLDCDNTLWKGVIAEDGLNGIVIDDDRKNFHRFLLEQYNSGMILCLCSKNNLEDVFNVFDNHPDMILRNNHITMSKINWSLKSENILELARELNLGLDSFVFVDDNPVECSEVSSRIPEALVINIPEMNVYKYFSHVWIFDRFKITKDDITRADFYRSDISRKQLSKEAFSFNDFIEKLEIKISIDSLVQGEVSRASQMTQRTNQFNLSTIRRDEGGILKLLNDRRYEIFSTYVSDRFGDYGFVGLIIILKDHGKTVVDTFLLSCRALGKGVEHAMIRQAGQSAIDNNTGVLELEYIPTKRNTPIANFLDVNFSKYRQTVYGKIIYLIPSEEAVGLKFKTDKPAEPVEETAEKKSSSENNLLYSKEKHIPDIAQNYDDVEKIVNAIDNWNKLNRPEEKKAIPIDTADHSDLERILLSVWREILKHESISVTDNFFEIGGKSVLIPPLIIRLKKEYNIELSIVDIFKYPTIQRLAAVISGIKNPDENIAGDIDINRVRDAKNRQKMRIQRARGLSGTE